MRKVLLVMGWTYMPEDSAFVRCLAFEPVLEDGRSPRSLLACLSSKLQCWSAFNQYHIKTIPIWHSSQ